MSLFAISDLHLGLGVSKPMSVFGARWSDHVRLLGENWLAAVGPDDTVLIPGDISWGMSLDEALPDLQYLDQLPGKKILSRGNHDYWWSSIRKIEHYCADHDLQTLSFLRNNSNMVSPEVMVCGTRGWLLPDDPEFGPHDEKIHLRELGRLKLSLDDASRQRKTGQKLVVCLHYPPFGRNGRESGYTELMSRYAVDACIFGHIHGVDPHTELSLPSIRIRYALVAADYLDFSPLCIFCCAGGGLVI